MNEKIKRLEADIQRLKNIAVDLKVDLNIRDTRILELEKELAEARRQIRHMEIGTQTMAKLEILDINTEEESFNPRQTGRFKKNPWEKVK